MEVARDPLLTVAMLRRTPMHRKHKCNTADVIFRLEIEKRELRRICRRAGPVLFAPALPAVVLMNGRVVFAASWRSVVMRRCRRAWRGSKLTTRSVRRRRSCRQRPRRHGLRRSLAASAVRGCTGTARSAPEPCDARVHRLQSAHSCRPASLDEVPLTSRSQRHPRASLDDLSAVSD